MGSERKLGYTYDDLHVGMSFHSPGRTITDADLVAFAGPSAPGNVKLGM